MSEFRLIGPFDLAERIACGNDGARCVVLEAHFTSVDHPPEAAHPNRHHIPGAIQVHPSYLEAGPEEEKYYPCYDCPSDGNLLPDEALVEVISGLGIGPETLVVVYGAEPAGTMSAARLVWGLMYAGVSRVEMLDGGIDAWMKSGAEVVSGIVKARDVVGEGKSENWRLRPDFLATTSEVRLFLRGEGKEPRKLIDVRKTGEWNGTLLHEYPFFAKAGHIPSALYQGDWDTLMEGDTYKLGPMLESVAERWREQGIIDAGVEDGETTLIFYCGTGWRSSVSFLVARLLGFRAKNYDDGFYGWSWHEEHEIETAGGTVKSLDGIGPSPEGAGCGCSA